MIRLSMFVLLCAIVSTAAHAQAVYFYADTALTAPGQCGIFLDLLPKVTAPTVLVGTIHTCKWDVSLVSNGSHTITATAIGVNDPLWGLQESGQAVPFTFVRPAAPSAPTNRRLGP